MLVLMFAAWLNSSDVRPLAEESWVYLDSTQVAYAPQPQAFQLQWQGGSTPVNGCKKRSADGASCFMCEPPPRYNSISMNPLLLNRQ